MLEIQHHGFPSSPAKITPEVRRIILWEGTKNPRVTSKDQQTNLALSDANVHESTIRQTLDNNSGHDRLVRRKAVLSKKNAAAHVHGQIFAQDHKDKPEDKWENLWIDKSKIELFGLN